MVIVAARLTAFFDTTTFSTALRAFVSVALADPQTLFTPTWPFLLLAALLGTVAVYALGSTLILLGPMAISGSDHFIAPGAAPPPLVTRGVFQFCDHPLFYVGLLLLWAVGPLACGSAAALRLVVFVHVTALGFLHGTEIPDMRRIYGPDLHAARTRKPLLKAE